MEAVEKEDIKVVKHLIQAGANVNAVNKGTLQTPLLCIPEKSEEALEISKELIAAGADVNYIQTFGSSVDRFLMDTDGDETYGLVKELLKTKDAFQYFTSPLKNACENGDYELVKELLKAGADVNLRWGSGRVAKSFQCSENFFQPLKNPPQHSAAPPTEGILRGLFLRSVRSFAVNLIEVELTRRQQKPTTLRSIGSTLRTARRGRRGIFFPYTSGRQRVF